MPGTLPVDERTVGALFGLVFEAVVVLDGDQALAWNGPAERLFGVTAQQATAPGARPLGEALGTLRALSFLAEPTRVAIPPHGTVEALRRRVEGQEVLILRDVTASVRREDGLRRLAALSRGLLGEPPALTALLQTLCGETKEMTGAAYSALLLGKEGATSHFAYDAPRALFPHRVPRAVGLIAVPLRTRGPARLDDVRGHPLGVGLPEVHPPLGPLVAVPLVAGDDVLGVLAAANPPGGRTFDEVDESLLVELAAQAAVAVAWAQVAERERERALVRAEALDAARHDIRTPLGAGQAYAKVLRERRDRLSDAQVASTLDGLGDALERIEAFVGRLVDPRDGTRDAPDWGEVPVGPLLAALRRDAAVVTGRDDALEVVVEDDAPATLAGDPVQVRSVLDAVLANALSAAGAAVLVLRADGDHVRFDLRDEGPGIADEDQSRLFDRWTGAGPGGPSGLGRVKRLVVAHGGTVGVSSRPGEGATVWVTFPRRRPQADRA